MDEDDYNSEEEKRSKTKKKMRYSTKYSAAFENDPLFKGWIKGSTKGDSYAFCNPCGSHLKLTAGKTDLKRHAGNKIHIDNAKAVQGQKPLSNIRNENKLKDSVNAGELRLSTFIGEHDLPMTVADHLPQLLQAVCPDSKIAQNITCARTKVTALINNVTGQEQKEQLIQHLKKNKFSLIVDESTDKGCVKHLCMVVRVMIENSVKDCFLGLVPVKDATPVSLYNHVVGFFTEHDISYKENMIGFAADGANSMLGAHHSLCVSYACLKLSRSLEDLARDIYSYFQCSP